MNLKIIQTPDYILGVEIKENYKITPDTVYFDKYSKVVNTAKASGYGTWYLVIGHIPLNNAKPLEGVSLLPDFELKGDFWENTPVRWIKWTKRKPNWNGSVYMQFNGKNQGNGLVHNGELIKLSGLANSEFKNYEDTFYWLEQDFNYKKDYKAAGGYTEEDMRKAISMARDIKDDSVHDTFTVEDISGCTEICTYGWGSKYSDEQIIKSLKPFPIAFEVEME